MPLLATSCLGYHCQVFINMVTICHCSFHSRSSYKLCLFKLRPIIQKCLILRIYNPYFQTCYQRLSSLYIWCQFTINNVLKMYLFLMATAGLSKPPCPPPTLVALLVLDDYIRDVTAPPLLLHPFSRSNCS